MEQIETKAMGLTSALKFWADIESEIKRLDVAYGQKFVWNEELNAKHYEQFSGERDRRPANINEEVPVPNWLSSKEKENFHNSINVAFGEIWLMAYELGNAKNNGEARGKGKLKQSDKATRVLVELVDLLEGAGFNLLDSCRQLEAIFPQYSPAFFPKETTDHEKLRARYKRQKKEDINNREKTPAFLKPYLKPLINKQRKPGSPKKKKP